MTSSSESPEAGQAARTSERLSWGHRAKNALRRRSRRYRDRESLREVVALSRRRDAAHNVETAPPSNETVKLQAVWIAESYPLSAIPQLADALDEQFGGSDPWGTTKSLRSLGAAPGGGSWSALGVVSQTGTPSFGHLAGKPPPGVDHVRLSLHMVFPSVAIVVGGFLLDDEAAERPTTILQRDYVSYGERLDPGGFQAHGPEWQKEEAIRELRRESKQSCAQWLADRFPGGLFASGVLEGKRFPALELWTTTLAVPLDETRTGSAPGYLRVLRLDRGIVLWRSAALPGFTMTEADGDGQGERLSQDFAYSLLLAGQEAQIFAGADFEDYGGSDRQGLMTRLDNDVDGVLMGWALLWTVRAFEMEVARIRDDLVALAIARSRAGAKRLQVVERDLMRRSGDALPLAADIASEKTYLPRRLRFSSSLDFDPVDIGFGATAGDDRKTWFEGLVDWVAVRANRLETLTREVREFQSGVGTALNTRTNLSLQRRIELLTWVVGIIAVATLAVTMIAEREHLDPLWDLLR